MSWKRTFLAGAIFVLMLMALMLDNVITYRKIIVDVGEASLAHSVNIRDVDHIQLKNSQGSVDIIRTSVGWQMKSPIDAPADPEIIETMLTNVTSARRRNKTDTKTLSEYGLANPEIQLFLGTDSGKFGDWGTSFGLELGYASTYTGQVFGHYPGKSYVFTVGDHVKNSLMRSPLDFRRSRLFDVDTGHLEKYTTFQIVQTNQDPVTLVQNKEVWSIAQPAEASAEQKVVTDYFNRLGMLRAINYITQNSERPTSMTNALAALSSPTISITLQAEKNSKPQQLVVGIAEGPDGSVYVAQRPGDQEIMVLTSETVDELRRQAQYFRSRDLFTLKEDAVGLFTVQIARAAPTALVRNDQDQWELVGDKEFRLNQQSINERLHTLLNLRIEEYVELNPVDLSNYGLDNPRLKFNVTNKDKSKTETLEIGTASSAGGSVSYARSSSDKGVFTLQMSPDLLIIASAIADKNVFAADLARLAKIELEVDGQVSSIQKDGNDWKLLKPGQSSPVAVDIRQVATLVAGINAIVYERDITSEGRKIIAPDPGPALKVRFYDADKNLLNEMNVQARINRQVVTVDNGRGRVFEVEGQIIDRLFALAKDIVQ